MAGPIEDGRCKTTNLPWEIDAHEIASAAALSTVALLNDLEVNAYGISLLREDEIHVCTPGKRKQAIAL